MNLDLIQAEHEEWAARNFPNAPDYHSLIGAMEELGELAHAWLKREQGIRGTERQHEEEARDAVGDIIIYLLHFCSSNRWLLSDIIEDTWENVRKRDWITNPENGGNK